MPKLKNSNLRIAVLGYIVRAPIGGLAWHHLQYVLGLKRLGHQVLFIEESEDYPACYNPHTNQFEIDPSYGLRFIDDCFKRLDLEGLWTYFDFHTNQWFGYQKANEFIQSADILLNLSGMNSLPEGSWRVPKRVFIDTDPVFVQIRHLTDERARKLAEQHNVFFTFGENFGAKDCLIPDDGFAWKATRQPVVLDIWRMTGGTQNANWTTIMQWDSYQKVDFGGRMFGMKSKSFEEFLDLPNQTRETFELGVGSASVPKELLQEKGWKIINPLIPTRTIWTYQDFIRNSKAEFSVAKDGYVKSRSGWFSERSAAYLASGRPVLTQETGFSKFIETGHGLFAFSDQTEVLAGIEKINRNYDFHCRAARQVAEDFFDHRMILRDLLEHS
jgi:hypothetical protein